VSKKRSPVQDSDRRERLIQQHESDQESELGLSNAAAQRQLAPVRADAEDLQLVRETALPTVEQALLAVQIAPRSTELTDKLLKTLEGSGLSEKRQVRLTQRLQEDQSIADLVARTVETSFGEDSPELREELWRALDRSWTALIGNEPSGEWSAELGAALGAGRAEGALSDRAIAMIGDLSAHFTDGSAAVSSEALAGDVSASVQQFCRSIALLLYWEEEEEEEGFELEAPELD
jgi:hypothetical protein